MDGSVGASLDLVTESLVRLGRDEVLARLRPGSVVGVEETLAARGLATPPDLMELLGWHDGTDVSGQVMLDDVHLLPGFYFQNFGDATMNYDAFVSSDRWHPAWFPLFANGGGDFYAVVCVPDRGDYASVIHFRIDVLKHPIEFSSLGSMLRTLAAALHEQVFYVDDHGYLEMADPDFADLATRLNADVPYWSR
jgi:cell wall assembly regulator SMI1